MARTLQLVTAAAVLAQSGSAAVLDLPIWYRNTYALVDVAVGTPPVNHSLLFDTGSATSWMVDDDCFASGGCRNFSGYSRTGYDRDASSTSVDLGAYGSIDYLGGVTAGPLMSDMFQLEDKSWNQTFMAANQSSWTWIPADGFFGMAFSTIAEPKTKTVVETMIQEGVLDEPKFAMYLGRESFSTGDGPGQGILTLGGSHEDEYVDGDMTWLTVKKDGTANGPAYQLWRSTLRSVTGHRNPDAGANGSTPIASGSIAYAAGEANGVFDTGAGVISVPLAAIEDLYSSIGWPGYQAMIDRRFVPLCTDFNETWSVTFSFSDDGVAYGNLTLRGDELRGRPGFANRDDACTPPFDDSGSPSLWLFGQRLIRRFYTVYDFGSTEVASYTPRIGFGQLKDQYRP